MIASPGTFQAPGAFGKCHVAPDSRVETCFLQFLRRIPFGPFAAFADHANEPLRHDAVESGYKVVRFDAHVDEAADNVGHVVGMDGGENQMAGERGLDGDLGGFLVADFADHDLVRVVAQDGTQAARKSETLLFIHGNLGDAPKLILDWIFDGDDFVFVALDFVDGGIKRGGLSGARRSCNQNHAVGFADVAAEAASLFVGKANHVQREAGEFFRKCFLVEDAENGVFAVTGGHNGNAQIDVAAFVFHAETAVLGDAALGNVQIT